MGRNGKPARQALASQKRSIALLEKLRQQQVEALADSLSGGSGANHELPPAPLAGTRISHLSEAIQVLKEDVGRAQDRRYAAGAILAILFAAGTLLFLRLFSTAVSGETKSGDLSFTLVNRAALFSGTAASAQFFGVGRAFRRNDELPVSGARLELVPAAVQPGSIGLRSMELPAGTRLSMFPTGSPNEIEIDFTFPGPSPPSLDVDLEGNFMLSGSPLAIPDPVRLEVLPKRNNGFSLYLGFSTAEVAFETPVEVTGVQWGRPSLALKGESSIVSGKISLDEVPDSSVTLRAAEPFGIGNSRVTLAA
jgi:hypothetical protein